MSLNFLVGCICTEVLRNEYSWTVVFDKRFGLTVECPWRIIVGGRIAVAHGDHEQRFGLPKAIDVPAETLQLLSNNIVVSVTTENDTCDLSIDFEGGAKFQTFADSSGYESWQIEDPYGRIIVGLNE